MRNFGDTLRNLRRQAKESLADVSGAVEIDVHELGKIEAGTSSPSEDVLLLLISHFSLKEDEAVNLWQLAGFDQSRLGVSAASNQPDAMPYTISGDDRVIYTDMVHVSANNYGVIVNFLQGLGGDGKPTAVSRVGMSREHAKSLIEVLERTIRLSEAAQPPKSLPE